VEPEPLAALAALCWGSSGLLAGFVSRSRAAVLVAFVAQLTGLAVVLVVALAGAAEPTLRAFLAGVIGGTIGGVGLAWLYRAFSGPSVGVAAPIAASGILLPVVAGLAGGERLGAAQGLGAAVLVAGLGAILYARPGEVRDRRAIRLAAGAALSFGCFYLALDVGARDSAAWVTAFARIAGSAVLLAMALRTRAPDLVQPGRWVAVAAVVGVVDVTGNFAYAAASAKGELSVVSLISAAYPAVTVVLAVLVLREPITVLRASGLAATVLGLGLIGT